MGSSDTRRECRPKGGNSYVTFRWLVGVMLGLVGAVGAGAGAYAAVESNIATLTERLASHIEGDKYRHTLQDGTNMRVDDKFRDLNEVMRRMELRQVRFEERLRVPRRERIPIPDEEDSP